MIFVSGIVPALMLYVALLYVILIRRFFIIRETLPISGLRGQLEYLAGKKKRMIAAGAVVFLVAFAGNMVTRAWVPDMLMVFHYEEASRGQNPNATRFNESDILSEPILEKVIKQGDLKLNVKQLSDFLSLSTPLDAQKLDVTQESDLKISTEYRIRCSGLVSLYRTNPRTVLNLLADVYWEDFVLNYAENDSILNLSFEELEGMEYLDVKDYLNMQANKLRNYLPGYSSESSSFRAEGSEETFSSLSQKITNFIDIELERYEAFVLENSLSKDRATYQSRMQYANHLLDTDRKKDMAAYDVRIEAINIYNAFMTRFVLIPTYDENKEFYMSKTKVGVDYFADEAKDHLESATKLVEEMEHNTHASQQIGRSQGSREAWDQADARIEELKAELLNLAAQCRNLCSAYVREKRDGYIQISFSSPDAGKEAVSALVLMVLFVIARGGGTVLAPLYKACKERQDKSISPIREGLEPAGEEAGGMEQNKEETAADKEEKKKDEEDRR